MRHVSSVIILLCTGISAAAQSEVQAPTSWQDIRPTLRRHCTVCHSAKNLKELDVSGGLALDTFDAVRKGSERAVLVPGKAAESLLFQLVTTSDVKKRMPLDAKPLPPES